MQHLTLSTYSGLGNVEILLHDVALNLLKLLPSRCSCFLELPGVSLVLLEFRFRQKNAEGMQTARIFFMVEKEERLSALPSLPYPPWERKRKQKPSGAVAWCRSCF